MVFCESVWLAEEAAMQMPTTEAEVVVPVPPAAVMFLTVFPEIVPMGAEFKIPFTMVPAAVDVLEIELATVPPIVLFWQVKVTPEPVFTRIP